MKDATRRTASPKRCHSSTLPHSGTTAPIEARRLSSSVDVVLPVVGETLPGDRQHVARAIQDCVTDDGDPPIYCGVSLLEPADVDLRRSLL